MKQKLQTCGVRVPIFMQIDKRVTFDFLVQFIGLPMVIKPKNSAGTNSVFIVKSAQDYQNVMRLIDEEVGDYQIEEFIDGILYHCDIAMVHNETIFSKCTQYLASTIQFQNGTPLGGACVGR